MLNKKAVEFLGGHALNIVLAVICILLLLALGVNLLFVFNNSKINAAEDVLETINMKINYFKTNNLPELVFQVYPPEERGWYLVNFRQTYFPEKECDDKLYSNCLCVCDGEIACMKPTIETGSSSTTKECEFTKCNGRKVCKGFQYPVVIDYTHEETDTQDFGAEGNWEFIYKHPEVIPLLEEIHRLRVSENQGAILIGNVQDE